MCTENETAEMAMGQTPQVFMQNIAFNDGTVLPLTPNSIVVFTGANNSGKSQILRDAENCLNKSNESLQIVLKNSLYDFRGNICDEAFLKGHFIINQQGHFELVGSGNSFDKNALSNWWRERTLYSDLHLLFVKRLSTEIRLTVSNALQREIQPESHPIYKLYKSEQLAQEISDYFHQAFGVDLIVNRNEMRTIPLHVGQAPDKEAYTIKSQDEYYDLVSALPKLQDQGDGMRSFASILLDTFTSEHSITLIDEPEAFLHPPQARVLGKMLAKNNPNNRQLFISTHSEDFLQGLLDADNENVTVIRINRVDNINKMSILANSEIKKLWSTPLLRYSNILSGLFHEKVVVCESDYDCLFYQAVMNAVYESKGEIAPDILFTHCGGKSRAKDVVNALRAVNVPVVAICDFDLLNASQNFNPLITAFGEKWSNILSNGMQTIYNNMNAKNSNGINAWEQIKKIGKAGFTGDAPAAYETVESMCKKVGLFIVPVGEMEGFDKTINKEKKDWVYHVLATYDLVAEPKLTEARTFVQAVVDFKIPEGI
ncbi:MAG: AAA family ATPase [Clostridia bacterium]|nr:AAA family ATPase [Clostridia bacterium]